MLAHGSRAESYPSCLTSHSDAHAHGVCVVHKWEAALSNPRKAPLAVTEHHKAQHPQTKLSRISSTQSTHGNRKPQTTDDAMMNTFQNPGAEKQLSRVLFLSS